MKMMKFCSEGDSPFRYWTVVELGELEVWQKYGELRLLRDRIVALDEGDQFLWGDRSRLMFVRAPQVGIEGEHRLVVVDLGREVSLSIALGSLSAEVVEIQFSDVKGLHPVSQRAWSMLDNRMGGGPVRFGKPLFEEVWKQFQILEACRASRRGGNELLDALADREQPSALIGGKNDKYRAKLDCEIDKWIGYWLNPPERDRSLGSDPGIDSNPFAFHPPRRKKDGKSMPEYSGGRRSLQILAGVLRGYLDFDAKDARLEEVRKYLKESQPDQRDRLEKLLEDKAFFKAVDSLAKLTDGSIIGHLTPFALLIFLHWRETFRERPPADAEISSLHRCFAVLHLRADFQAALYLLGRYLSWAGLAELPALLGRLAVVEPSSAPEGASAAASDAQVRQDEVKQPESDNVINHIEEKPPLGESENQTPQGVDDNPAEPAPSSADKGATGRTVGPPKGKPETVRDKDGAESASTSANANAPSIGTAGVDQISAKKAKRPPVKKVTKIKDA
jgi:hypothetical protein